MSGLMTIYNKSPNFFWNFFWEIKDNYIQASVSVTVNDIFILETCEIYLKRLGKNNESSLGARYNVYVVGLIQLNHICSYAWEKYFHRLFHYTSKKYFNWTTYILIKQLGMDLSIVHEHF